MLAFIINYVEPHSHICLSIMVSLLSCCLTPLLNQLYTPQTTPETRAQKI